MKIIESNIELARKSRGKTQKDLAQLLMITQSNISKIEQGLLSCDIDLIGRISNILDYPIEFFTTNIPEIEGETFYRKRVSLPSKIVEKINSIIRIRLYQINKLLKSVELENERLPYNSSASFNTPEKNALLLREYWGVKTGPISNLTELLEKNGCIIVHIDVDNTKFDGISPPNNYPPIIFLNQNMPGDRLRFSLAHELGHIILHKYNTSFMEEEDEANRFASEFLMPSDDIRPHLYNLDLKKLIELKKYWKVSIQSILKKAKDLKVIAPSKSQHLWMQISKLGYRKNEPINISVEEPRIIKDIIKLYLEDLDYSIEEISKIVNLCKDEFIEIYQPNPKIIKLKLFNA